MVQTCLEAFAADEAVTSGAVVFVTPEIGAWCTVGGLGVMVRHLSQAFAERGIPTIAIAPAYASCAAQWASATQVGSLAVPLGSQQHVIYVWLAQEAGAAVYLLECSTIFDVPYPQGWWRPELSTQPCHT